MCDQEIPTAKTADIKTNITQFITVTLSNPNHPQSINSHKMAAKNNAANVKPINPSERNVARR